MQTADSYTPLERKFRSLTSEELAQSDFLASISDSSLLTGTSWEELLEQSRVLLLAEAGSGKTTEMREAAARLNANGKHAFVLPLEDLDKDGIPDILSGDSLRRFQAWRQDGQAIGWFFLDAVDELKLHLGSLERALRRFARDVDGLLARTRVLVSSRPHDWQPSADMVTLKQYLPIVPPSTGPMEAKEAFLKRLQPPGAPSEAQRGRKPVEAPAEPLVVILLPLGSKQIDTYVRARANEQDASAFLAELRQHHAQMFARRPADLAELFQSWKVHKALGTRERQHETNVTIKLSDVSGRPDASLLTDKDARSGAERLALALALMRRRTIRSPEASPFGAGASSDAVLDPALVLQDYTSAARESLLRRGLFDPATYGRIRFHDRSVQEYLAAKRLHWLRSNGMTRSSLHRLLFAEVGSHRLTLPSMRPIAAWLALWDIVVRRELIVRQPEVLATMGDPAAMQLEDKASVIKAFAAAYGTGGGRGLNVPIDSVRRLADAGLEPVIRELWGKYKHQDDVSELLLELLWQSKSTTCNDICLEAALDVSQHAYHRVIAIRTLVGSGSTAEGRQVVDSMMGDPGSWPDRVTIGAAADLYPGNLTLDELCELIRRTPEPKSVVSGFAWQTQLICKTIDPGSADAGRLAVWLSDLIWDERRRDASIFQVESKRSYLSAALAILCTRRLHAGTDPGDAALARACAIANRFVPHRDTHSKESVALREAVRQSTKARETAFWLDVEVIRELEPAVDAWHQYYNALHDGIVPNLAPEDEGWLLSSFRQRADIWRAEIALYGLLALAMNSDDSEAAMASIAAEASTDNSLSEIFKKFTSPSRVAVHSANWEQRQAQRRAQQERMEADRLQRWTDWRDRALADPQAAFSDANLEATLTELHDWLSAGDFDLTSGATWQRDTIASAFNDEFARLAEDGFKRFWRAVKIDRHSEGSAAPRLQLQPSWFVAQWGIAAEAESKSWAVRLTPSEARQASELATNQMNGLAEWLEDVATAFPAIVEDVLGTELEAEVANIPTLVHLPTLQDIRHAGASIRRLMYRRVAKVFDQWPAEPLAPDLAVPFSHVVEQLVEILLEAAAPGERVSYGKLCLDRSALATRREASLQWLRGSLLFDFVQAATALEARLGALPPKDGAGVLAAMFDRHRGVAIHVDDPDVRARVLGSLVRTAYRVVAIEHDQTHEGSYTPNERDHAEVARGVLFSALLDTPGPRAQAELLAMANEPLFAHTPDRLRLLARERMSTDAEFPSLDEATFRLFEESRERPAVDRDSLAEIAESRLVDLQHDISHHDFSDRGTLQTIVEESAMQRTLALRLESAKNGAYVVTREEEVADLKKTDIRLAAVMGSARYTIEVKIADGRWSQADFEHALEHQLLGQYLRHANALAGCLLLTYNGNKKTWRKGKSGKSLNFEKLVEHLTATAKVLERREEGRVRLAVIGLDLRDPKLVPAHR